MEAALVRLLPDVVSAADRSATRCRMNGLHAEAHPGETQVFIPSDSWRVDAVAEPIACGATTGAT
jgi:hypothetical protein